MITVTLDVDGAEVADGVVALVDSVAVEALGVLRGGDLEQLGAELVVDGLVLSRQQLLERVWEYEFGDERLVDVHIGRIRHKIEDDPAAPQRLVTARGLGYKLQR